MQKYKSVEHLLQDDRDGSEDEQERSGYHSATSSPVLPRRRRKNERNKDYPELVPQGFHLATLPRKKVVPPPAPKHAMSMQWLARTRNLLMVARQWLPKDYHQALYPNQRGTPTMPRN